MRALDVHRGKGRIEGGDRLPGVAYPAASRDLCVARRYGRILHHILFPAQRNAGAKRLAAAEDNEPRACTDGYQLVLTKAAQSEANMKRHTLQCISRFRERRRNAPVYVCLMWTHAEREKDELPSNIDRLYDRYA